MTNINKLSTFISVTITQIRICSINKIYSHFEKFLEYKVQLAQWNVVIYGSKIVLHIKVR